MSADYSDGPRHPERPTEFDGNGLNPELTEAARALTIGIALFNHEPLEGIGDDLERIGLSKLPPALRGWEPRILAVQESDLVLNRFGLRSAVSDMEESYGTSPDQAVQRQVRQASEALWPSVATESEPSNCFAWLRLALINESPVITTAAASALSGWRATRGIEPPPPFLYAKWLVGEALASDSSIAREIAQSTMAHLRWPKPYYEYGPEPTGLDPDGQVSTMVHGTRAYAGDWWNPGGDFHSYVKSSLRPDLYDGANYFDWSGAYRAKDRERAARKFAAWAAATDGDLNTVFAHSYGGCVAMHATTFGLKMRELVLLSVPVESVPIEWRNIGRSVSLRIHLDLVLLAARRRQRFVTNVEEHYLPHWFRKHKDSHCPEVWEHYDCASTLSL